MDLKLPQGATPLNDCSDLLVSWVQTIEDLNRVEAENISYAQTKYLKADYRDIKRWFNSKGLMTIHKDMFGRVWAWAGKFRKTQTSIGVSPELIPTKLAELCEEISAWSREAIELTFVERSARVHHRLVQIHPFENGNGRFSRLIADCCLLCWKCPHSIWPSAINRTTEDRKSYIYSLKCADKGDIEELVALMKKYGASDPDSESYKRAVGLKNEKTKALLKALIRRETNLKSKNNSLRGGAG